MSSKIDRRTFIKGAAASSLLTFAPAAIAETVAKKPAPQQAAFDAIYPVGQRFPLVWMAVNNDSDIAPVAQYRQYGWNTIHRYNSKHQTETSFLQNAANSGLGVWASLPGTTKPLSESKMKSIIQGLAPYNNLVWWDFPEERRYWIADEMAIVTNYAQYTRKYDPQRRPNYMYIPGHYEDYDIAEYVPYLDIISASNYTNYMEMPAAWCRWHMEQAVKGIQMAGATIGPDYLNGQKTPISVLELFWAGSWGDITPVPTPASVYHDFWQSIVSGAQGIVIYSYARRNDEPTLATCLARYNEAAGQLTGIEKLDSVVLRGTKVANIGVTITAGPQRTPQFTPILTTHVIDYPSVDVLVKRWNNKTYIIAVSSSDQPVTATISGLPLSATQATVLFENRSVPVSSGQVSLSFAAIGVHILRIDAI